MGQPYLLFESFVTAALECCCRGVGVTICCPGPIATGTDGKLRNVYGASALVQHAETSAAVKKRMDPARTAAWIGAAAYHGLDEAWISKQPVLALSAPPARVSPLHDVSRTQLSP